MGGARRERPGAVPPPTGTPAEPDGWRLVLVRARWRLAGAWAGPTFVLCVAVGTVLLRVLPVAGDDRPSWFGAFLAAGFLNLLCVSALAVVAGGVLRRRDRSLPRLVARDRAATVAMLAGVALLVTAGVAHRGRLAAERDRLRAAVEAVQVNVAVGAPARFRGPQTQLDVRRQANSDLYRACSARPRDREAYCLWVDTGQRPPGLTVDDDRTPNWRRAGIGAPGPERLE